MGQFAVLGRVLNGAKKRKSPDSKLAGYQRRRV